jgi:class 3 adenylate cyclase
VTALLCDLVGSTELAERIDPEALRKVLDRYFSAMRSAIERHGGTVEKFIGDAVVGSFGVPVAHEDDTLRAVRAGLEMRSAADDLDRELRADGVRVRVRIGIDAGEAFADEAAAVEGRIAGDVFNTAARIQSAAEPGEILLTSAAEQLVRGRVQTDAMPPLTVKGKAEPVAVVRANGLAERDARTVTPNARDARGRAARG